MASLDTCFLESSVVGLVRLGSMASRRRLVDGHGPNSPGRVLPTCLWMIAAIIIDGFAYYIEIVARRCDGQEPGSGKEVNYCLRAVSTATSLTENPKTGSGVPLR